jgi:radical SAM superfamily enzyme YgiQ (UPF0313 family)
MLPLSIGYLGGVLERHGVGVELCDDAVHSDEEIEAAIARHDVVGISAMTSSAKRALDLAAIAKRHGKIVVVGGAHASCSPQDFLASGNVDLVAKGEAEETIVELLHALPHRDRWHQVAGIGFIQDGSPTFTAPRPLPVELDSIPFPAWHLLPVERYWAHQRKGREVALFSSRGCPWACTYCNKLQSTRKYRVRSPRNTVDEIEWLVSRFGVTRIFFPDDLFTLYEERTVGICTEILKRGLAIQWTCITRVDCVNPQMLRWMRKAGCIKISYGVESGSPKMLKAMRKQFSLEQIVAAAQMTRDAAIRSTFFIILGFPGETWEDVELTKHMLRTARPDDAGVNIFNLLPGTETYEQYKHLLHDPSFEGLNFMDGDEGTGFAHETFSNHDLQRIREDMILEHRQLMRTPLATLERKLRRGLWYLSHPEDAGWRLGLAVRSSGPRGVA